MRIQKLYDMFVPSADEGELDEAKNATAFAKLVQCIDMYIDWIAHLYHWQLNPELRHVLRLAAMFDGPTSRSEGYRFVL